MKHHFLTHVTPVFIIFVLSILFNTGCRYDKPEIMPVGCDTMIVTFSGSVKPILNAHCINCHSGPSAPLIRLDSYLAVKAVASNGKLLGTITHSPGFSPMPQNDAKLNDCKIGTIRKWINEGALNN